MSYALYKTGSYHNYGNVTGGGGIEFSGGGSTLINQGTITGTTNDGVRLLDGGEVRSSGSIGGSFAGIQSDGSTYIFNSGSVTGNVIGVLVNSGTIFSSGDGITSNALISGGIEGIHATSAYSTVGNGYGTVYGGVIGVYLSAGGTVNNGPGAITGGTTAIDVQGAIGNVTNSGFIQGGQTQSGNGVQLGAGGSVNNTRGIYTNGGSAVYSAAGVSSGFVTNSGRIVATGGHGSAGVYLKGNYGLNTAGGDVSNQANGLISGYVGVSITNGGYVVNSGSILGVQTTGVLIDGAGNVVNHKGGVINGANYGVKETGLYSAVNNYASISGQTAIVLTQQSLVHNFGGSITGYASTGVFMSGGGSVYNSVYKGHRGSIYGASTGILAENAAIKVTNSGDITGFYYGVSLLAGGTVVNAKSGAIAGHYEGVLVSSGNATITDAGTITSSQYAVKFNGGGTDRLIVDPGAVFTGAVSGAGAHSTLELAKGASAGAITGLGTAFTGFAAINVDTGASWTASGSNSVVSSTAVTVKGALDVTGTSTFSGNVSGAGSISIASHAVLSVGGSLGVAKLSFLAGGSETAVLGKPTSVSATIAGFAATDKIDLANFVVSGHTFSGTTLTLDHTGGSAAHLHFSSSYTGQHFAFASDGHGGTNISLV